MNYAKKLVELTNTGLVPEKFLKIIISIMGYSNNPENISKIKKLLKIKNKNIVFVLSSNEIKRI